MGAASSPKAEAALLKRDRIKGETAHEEWICSEQKTGAGGAPTASQPAPQLGHSPPWHCDQQSRHNIQHSSGPAWPAQSSWGCCRASFFG